MSRYFNSIARQMGGRFSQQKGRPTRTGPQLPKGIGEHEPLERDEIVLVASNKIIKGETAASRDPESAEKAIQTKQPRKQTSKNITQENALGTRAVVKKGGVQDREPDLLTTLETKDATVGDRTNEDAADRQNAVAYDVETTIESKSGRKDAETKVAWKPPRKEEPVDADKEVERVFFEKTSEIIQGRQAEPDEVRNIVIREVQEWVAAVPVEPARDPEKMSGDDYQEQPGEPRSTLIARQKEALISIADEGSKTRSKEQREQQTVEEHFELSIGTISVTIEGDEKPVVQNELPPRREQARTTGAERSASSLLDRSYL